MSLFIYFYITGITFCYFQLFFLKDLGVEFSHCSIIIIIIIIIVIRSKGLIN